MPEAELDKPHVVDVCREAEDGRLWPDDRARQEEEVCFSGFVEREYQVERHELRILDWDDSTLAELAAGRLMEMQQKLYAAYGVDSVNVAGEMQSKIQELGGVILKCVASNSTDRSTAEIAVREQLASMAHSALRQALLKRYELTADSRQFGDDAVVQGTKK